MIDLITGHQGVPHISAEQVSTINNVMMYGYGQDAVVRLKDGTISMDGLEVLIDAGYWRANGYDIQITEDESVILDPTSAGMSRIDVVYAEILQDIPSGAQRVELVVIRGEENVTPTQPPEPTAPALTTDILILALPIVICTVSENTMTIADQTLLLKGPDSEDVETLENEMDGVLNQLGSKNLFYYPYSSGSTTSADVQFTDNGDGSVTAIGTASATSYYNFSSKFNLKPNTEYILSFEGDAGSDSTYFIMFYERDSGGNNLAIHYCYGPDIKFTTNASYAKGFAEFRVMTGKSISTTIKPMIRLASINDNTWAPYAATNQTLTNIINNISRYGTSSTGAPTTKKIAYSTDRDYVLNAGNKIYVKFTYTNTATSPTLNVDGTGDINIKGYGATKPDIWWNAGDVVEFVYDGTNYIMSPTQGQISTLNAALSNKQDKSTAVTLKNTLIHATNGTAWYDLEANGFDITKPIFGFVNSNDMGFDFCAIPYEGVHIANGYGSGGSLTYGASATIRFQKDASTQHFNIKINQVFINGIEYSAGAALYLYLQS